LRRSITPHSDEGNQEESEVGSTGGLEKKTPIDTSKYANGGEQKGFRVGEAGQNSHPTSMIYNIGDKSMQEKKPPLTLYPKANGGRMVALFL
jgi:hypothetical protein